MRKFFANLLGKQELLDKILELESKIKILELLFAQQASDIARINELLSIIVMTNPQLRAKKMFDEEVSGSITRGFQDKTTKDELN